MRQAPSQQLASSIVEFCRFLRAQRFAAGIRQAMTALNTVAIVDVADEQSFRCALRTALCSNREEWERFPRFFIQFWGIDQIDPRAVPGGNKRQSKRESSGRERGASVFGGQSNSSSLDADEMQRAIYGASAELRLRQVDFSEVPASDLHALEEISARLLRRMMQRLSRRLAVSSNPIHADLRRSIRRSIAHGGEPMTLAYKARKRSRNRFVLLIDISGSMSFYSLFLVRFAYALQAHCPHVQTFLFSTGVVPISDLLRRRNLREALRQLSQRAAGWSGGTKIGESIREFHRSCARSLTRDTVLMILSDGWETGDPQLLADEMRSLRRRIRRLIWLNPLLGLKEYQPATRGMLAALPYVDVFAPAHNLESLLALEKQL